MDSFETILELLKQAQGRGRDAVAGKLETIAEKLGQLVDETTASVREIAAQEADELLPVADLRSALEDFHRQAAEQAEEKNQLVQRLQQAEKRIEEAAPSVSGPSLELLRGLDSARSQSELLRELLPALCHLVARAAVLVIRGGDVNAWSGIGFADGEGLREWRCGTPDSPALARMVADQRPVAFKPGQDPVFDGWLESEAPAGEALLVPVCLRGQLMGCVYVDDGGEGPWDPGAVQGMVAVACWMIDTLHARQVVPTPMLAEALQLEDELPGSEAVADDQVVFDAPPAEPEAEFEAESDDETPGEDEAPPDAEAVDEVPQAVDEEAELEPASDEVAEFEEEAEEQEWDDVEADAADDYDPSATMRVEVAPELEEESIPVHEQETVIEEEPPPAPEAADEAVDEAVDEEEPEANEVVTPAQPVVPPPPLEPEAESVVETEFSPEEEVQHEEARRFARLLISEIKLYNEEEVERGRAAKDIYARLREDIDRSREMYEKRISEDVRRVTDYFDQELIRILAEGDSDALGM